MSENKVDIGAPLVRIFLQSQEARTVGLRIRAEVYTLANQCNGDGCYCG